MCRLPSGGALSGSDVLVLGASAMPLVPGGVRLATGLVEEQEAATRHRAVMAAVRAKAADLVTGLLGPVRMPVRRSVPMLGSPPAATRRCQ